LKSFSPPSNVTGGLTGVCFCLTDADLPVAARDEAGARLQKVRKGIAVPSG
jgi:hypothetical protein